MLPNDTLAEFRIRQVPAEKRLTDFVGLVIQPDATTIRKSYELAASLMPKTSEVTVAPGSLPHMTLGFDPRLAVDGTAGQIFENQDHPHAMQVDRVVLAKMGRHGRVEYVLSL